MRTFRGTGTGWRRLIGSPKLQIIFHKRATNYMALLLKMTYKDKGSYESLPTCSWARDANSYSAMHITKEPLKIGLFCWKWPIQWLLIDTHQKRHTSPLLTLTPSALSLSLPYKQCDQWNGQLGKKPNGCCATRITKSLRCDRWFFFFFSQEQPL